MNKPSFDEWFNAKVDYLCDVTVKCTDGSVQNINECNFNYGFRGNELVTKKGYKISDYFFVDQVIEISNYRVVE